MLLDKYKDREEKVASRLVFQAKGAVYGGERAQVQRHCEEVAILIQSFLPGCQDVQKILNARVPLIKYIPRLAGLECDLSMSLVLSNNKNSNYPMLGVFTRVI